MNTLEQLKKEAYYSIPDAEGDMELALLWAIDTLKSIEGGGHIFELVWTGTGIVCHFSKPEWAGEHWGNGMRYGSEAIIDAVTTYMEELGNV